MPASLAPITPELLADFKGGKEAALEQVFRANFDAFTQEANAKLEDMAAAQKVAASAFLDVWDRRAKVESAAQLEALLHQAVGGEAAHELRRRAAAHRMGDASGEHKAHDAPAAATVETVDQWWAKCAGVLHAARANPDDVARQRAEHSRHEAAAHLKKVAAPKRRTGLVVALVVVVAVGAGVPLWYFNKGAESTKAGQLLGREDAKVIRSNNGQVGAVTLEDSVGVRIGSATTVKYPAHYPMDARALLISGVAAIKAPADGSPVMVKVGNLWVYASGAEFAARSFPEDSGAVMLKALAGDVEIRFGQEMKALKEGSTTYVLSNGTFMDLSADKAALGFSWLDGKFVSDHLPLRKVLTEMKKWYALEITAKDTSFLDRPVAMTASLDSAKVAVAALEAGGSVKIKLESEGKASLTDNAAALKKN